MSALLRRLVAPARAKRAGSLPVVAVGVLLTCSLLASGCQVYNAIAGLFEKKRTPERFIFPEGFEGWYLIEWGVPGAPPVSEESGFRVHRIPACGYLAYSSRNEVGWAADEFFFARADGALTPILIRLGSSPEEYRTFSGSPRGALPVLDWEQGYLGPKGRASEFRMVEPGDFPMGTKCQ
jgi:hypothetical protein